MTIINQKSISGITSITTAAAGDNLLTVHTNDGSERLRITSNGRIGIGTASPTAPLAVMDASDPEIRFGYNETQDHKITWDSSKVFLEADPDNANGSSALGFKVDGTEAARFDSSSRLLVGTDSSRVIGSARKVQVEGTSDATAGVSLIRNSNDSNSPTINIGKSRGTSTGSNTVVQSGDGLGSIYFRGADGSDINTIGVAIEAAVDGTPGSNDMPGRLVFSTTADGASSPTERLRIDSSGRVMLGTTTPGPTAGEHLTIEDSANAGITIRSGTSAGGAILFEDDTADRGEIQYSHNGDFLRIKTAGSERLRIDSDGRLLVGASTARGNFYNSSGAETRFLVEGTTFTTSSAALVRNSNNASDAELVFAKSRGTSVGSNTVVQDDDNLGAISFQGSDGAQFVEAASITAFVDATPGSNDMPGRLSFGITHNGASTTVERLRINHKGFLKAGPRIADSGNGVADLDSARHEFTSDDNGWTIIVTHTSGAASEHEGILIDYKNSPNGTGNSYLQGNDSNGTRFRMASNGGLYNYQSNNSNLSDEREKKNIVSLDTKWDKVKSWELKKFHYNEDADSDDLRYGVIAQQVEDHCPEVLSEWVKQEAKDAVLDENDNVVTPAQAEVVRKGVKEQQMMWMAIKALQEAQTRIETLETQNTAQQTQINDLITRITALEG